MFKKAISFIACLCMMAAAFVTVPAVSQDGKVFAASSSMKIYGIYMKRASGSARSSDRYGDAVLIESGGKYLLMDTGAEVPVKGSGAVYPSDLVKTLKKIGVKRLDVYISHLHMDHQGGLADVCKNFRVDKLYLPDLNLCKGYVTPNVGKTINAMYYEQIEKARKGLNGKSTEIVNLVPNISGKSTHYNYKSDINKKNLAEYKPYIQDAANASGASTFTVGSVSAKVLGPVGTYTMKQFASQDGKGGSMEGHYLNNTSLTTMLTCGSVKFLTCGDIEKIEEKKIAAKYGSSLSAGIMKVSHHGISTSSDSSLVSRVAPTWSFDCNNGYGNSHTGRDYHRKYGYYYSIEGSKHSIIYRVDNGKVRVYKDSNNNGKPDERPLTGWVNVNGRYQRYSGSGYLYRGWTQIGSYKYYMASKSGFRCTGTHKIYGVTCKFTSKGVLTSPGKPSKVKLSSVKSKSSRSVTVSWKKATGASRYEVYRATSKNGKYTKITTLKNTRRSYKDSNLKKGKRYYYKVRAIRYVAKTTLYGSYSSYKYATAR